MNASNCEYVYDKLCDTRLYLDYKNCKCKKKIFDKLVEECSENFDGNEIIYETVNSIPLNDYKSVRNSCTMLQCT